MDDPALDAELIALVEEAITHLAPGVQPLCFVQAIEDAPRSLGSLRVMDLHILLSGAVIILLPAPALTPIWFLMVLKQPAATYESSQGATMASPICWGMSDSSMEAGLTLKSPPTMK